MSYMGVDVSSVDRFVLRRRWVDKLAFKNDREPVLSVCLRECEPSVLFLSRTAPHNTPHKFVLWSCVLSRIRCPRHIQGRGQTTTRWINLKYYHAACNLPTTMNASAISLSLFSSTVSYFVFSYVYFFSIILSYTFLRPFF